MCWMIAAPATAAIMEEAVETVAITEEAVVEDAVVAVAAGRCRRLS
jgi:hypothetical protein